MDQVTCFAQEYGCTTVLIELFPSVDFHNRLIVANKRLISINHPEVQFDTYIPFQHVKFKLLTLCLAIVHHVPSHFP